MVINLIQEAEQRENLIINRVFSLKRHRLGLHLIDRLRKLLQSCCRLQFLHLLLSKGTEAGHLLQAGKKADKNKIFLTVSTTRERQMC